MYVEHGNFRSLPSYPTQRITFCVNEVLGMEVLPAFFFFFLLMGN